MNKILQIDILQIANNLCSFFKDFKIMILKEQAKKGSIYNSGYKVN